MPELGDASVSTTPEEDDPVMDAWNVSDSANELGVDAFSASNP